MRCHYPGSLKVFKTELGALVTMDGDTKEDYHDAKNNKDRVFILFQYVDSFDVAGK